MEAGSVFELKNDRYEAEITVINAKTANNKTAFLGVDLERGAFYAGIKSGEKINYCRDNDLRNPAYSARETYNLLCLAIE